MKIPLKAKVICKDGEYGKVLELIIDPVKEKVTHVVIINEHNNLEILVPVDDIDYSTDNVITLEKTSNELNKYPPFLINEFIKVPTSEIDFAYWGADPTMSHSYTMFPYVIKDGDPALEVKKEDIPKGEISYRRGMTVKDNNDKKIGTIDEFIVDSETDKITHMVMRSGHIFGSRDVAIPNVNVVEYKKDCVILNITREDAENLPSVVIKRSWN